jgi:hypothetical protein
MLQRDAMPLTCGAQRTPRDKLIGGMEIKVNAPAKVIIGGVCPFCSAPPNTRLGQPVDPV